MKPTLFIDRDGTLIFEPLPDQKVDRLDKIEFEPLVIPALLRLQDVGFRLVMVTNQDGIGSPDFPTEAFEIPQKFVLDVFESQGIHFNEVYVCPHTEEANCECRKPKLGMVLTEISENRFDPACSWVIGDRQTDVQLAEGMGIQGILYKRGQLGWPEVLDQILSKE